MSKPHLVSFLIAFFCIISFQAFSQNKAQYRSIIFRIDSLANAGRPKSALSEVNRLDSLARKNSNAAQQIKAVIYRMNFQSYLEENALEAIVNRLKLDIEQSTYPAKPILRSLVAGIYWNYYKQHRYQFSNRTLVEKPDADFTRWDLKTIVDEVSKLYKSSLTDSLIEQKTSVSVFDEVLIGDAKTRYLRPTLYDLLAHRALDFFLDEEPNLLNPRLPFTLKDTGLFLSNEEFLNTSVNTSDTASLSYQGIKLLKDLTRFHLKRNDHAALANIDLRRLDFLYRKLVHTGKEMLYLQSLNELASKFSDTEISADAYFKIGELYKRKDSLRIAKSVLDRAVLSFPKSVGGKNASNLIKEIEKKEMSVTLENVSIPARPILVLLNYRNVNKVRYRLFKLSEKRLRDIAKLDERGSRWRSQQIQPSDTLLHYLDREQALSEETINAIDPGDFRKHSTEFKLDPLEPGSYLLLTKDASNDEKEVTNLVEFKVTKLAYAARIMPSGELEIKTLNRENGAPLSGVDVTVKEIQYFSERRNDITLGTGRTDASGAFLLPNVQRNGKQTEISLSYAGDSFEDALYLYGALSKTNDNDSETDRTIFFTDRQIYRPGQTVYFKGIQVVQSKSSSNVVANLSIDVEFRDANSKKISSLKLTTNEFGTFAGSFIIPQNTLNGGFTIKTGDGSIAIQVEEYKRPTFQVELDPVKESYRLNDTVTITGRVRAFSGYGISQANVSYRITRRKADYISFRYHYFTNQTEIEFDTLRADNSGEFRIRFKAVPEDGATQQDLVYNYLLSV